MFQIPQRILENLKCSVCDGYLSSKPVVVKFNRQICGKCYKILPPEDKKLCVKQVSFEAIGEILNFPCRYKTRGCNYTFTWDNENSHEAECDYRYTTTPEPLKPHLPTNENVNPTQNKNEVKCESDQVRAQFTYEVIESKYSRDFKNLTYMLNTQGNYGKTLARTDVCTSDKQSNINHSIEGAVSLANVQEMVYSDTKITPVVPENIYDSLKNEDVFCLNCKNPVIEDDNYNCLFGHVSCVNCKGNMCIICINQMEKDSKVICKNSAKGCRQKLLNFEASAHQQQCKYNDVRCPCESCNVVDILANIKLHLKQNHTKDIYITNEITKRLQDKDDTIVMLCYDSIFKCVYYYYKGFVEFFVIYIGPSEEASNYVFEISVTSNNKRLTKKSKCTNWNDSMLVKGVTFERKELVNKGERKIDYEINLRLLHFKK